MKKAQSKSHEFHAGLALDSLASRWASRRAPKSAIDPIQAGMGGAFAAALVIIIFTAVAGLELEEDDLGVPLLVAILISSGIPYWFFESKNRAHFRESWEERKYLSELTEDELHRAYIKEFGDEKPRF